PGAENPPLGQEHHHPWPCLEHRVDHLGEGLRRSPGEGIAAPGSLQDDPGYAVGNLEADVANARAGHAVLLRCRWFRTIIASIATRDSHTRSTSDHEPRPARPRRPASLPLVPGHPRLPALPRHRVG